MHQKGVITIVMLYLLEAAVCELEVRITNNGPVVLGGTVNFNATVYDGDQVASGKYDFDWFDNAVPQHRRHVESTISIDSWNVTYNANDNKPGEYAMRVDVCKWKFIGLYCIPLSSAGTFVKITSTLNGDINLIQKNQTTKNTYVSNSEPVIHEIALKKSDYDYIRTAPTLLTYWFVDCVYYGITNDFKFPFNYTKSDENHFVEALVMADFTPLPPTTTVAPSTTTTKPTTTKSTTITTTTTTTTPKTSSVTPSTNNTKVNIVKRNIIKNETNNIMTYINGTLVKYNGTFPYVCNSSVIIQDQNKTYGHFTKKITVKAPVSKVNVTGKNWLEPGELLTLKVSCKGSQTMEFCVQYIRGEYNVTGNETCRSPEILSQCDFAITRYISVQHTILIIIQNDVSRIVTPVTVKISTFQKRTQLSVIFVPVSFSIVAVVLIVFGVAYYMQNRSRFVVEVADFNFGKQYADMEYKTFRERLRDSITNAFSRGPSPSSSEVPVWPPGRKYGSMT